MVKEPSSSLAAARSGARLLRWIGSTMNITTGLYPMRLSDRGVGSKCIRPRWSWRSAGGSEKLRTLDEAMLGKRGPKPKPKLTPFEAAIVRYGLPPANGVAMLSEAWATDRVKTMRALAGELPAPSAAWTRVPGSVGSLQVVPPSPSVSNLDVGYALMLPSLVDPRRGSSPPARCNVGFDRLEIDMHGVGPDVLVPRVREKVSLPLPGFAGWTMQRHGEDWRFSEDAPFARNVGVYAPDGVPMATFRCEPRFPRLPELRLDLTGAAWRRGVAAKLGAEIIQALAPMETRIAEVHVAIDLDADLDDFVPFVRDVDVKWPRLPEMRAFLVRNNAVASGYEWSARDESVRVVVYDKIAQTRHVRLHAIETFVKSMRAAGRKTKRAKNRAAHKMKNDLRTELPLHAQDWSELMRVEVKLKPGRAQQPRDAVGALAAIRTCFDAIGLADLRLLDGFDTMAVFLGQARAFGFRSHAPDAKTMKFAHKPPPPKKIRGREVPYDGEDHDAIAWPDFGSRLLKRLKRGRTKDATATEAASAIHAAVLERLRALDSRAPLRLVEQFDRAEADLRATLAAMGVR